VHDFGREGSQVMIGASTIVRSDVIPYGLANGQNARLAGLNLVGMKRRKFPTETVRTLRVAYRMLFFGKDVMERRLEVVESKFGDNEAVAQIVAFIRNAGSRPLCHASPTQEN